MATAQFSEFSFGFAYSREVVDTCWSILVGAPTLPSLYDEGRAGGFDVAIGLLGWTYFAQFKRADFLSRTNATWWDYHGGPYYRFPITRHQHSRQHELLLALEQDSVFNIVEYVAPRFHTGAALSTNFVKKTILTNSLRIYPRSIGAVVDDEQHYLTYTESGGPVVRSEPVIVGLPYNAGPLHDWRPADGSDPTALDADAFDEISEKLISHSAGARGEELRDGLSELSSFGRARTLGRLLVGAELIPIVVAQGQT